MSINRETQLADEAAGLLNRLLDRRGPSFPGENDRVERIIGKANRRYERRWAAMVETPEWRALQGGPKEVVMTDEQSTVNRESI